MAKFVNENIIGKLIINGHRGVEIVNPSATIGFFVDQDIHIIVRYG